MVSALKAHPVRARVVSTGVQDGCAVSRIEIDGATPAQVRDMFLEEPPGSFFPGASSFLRHPTENGGQAYLENPLGGPPLMYTSIEPTPEGIAGRFQGLMKGSGELSIAREGPHTVIREKTRVRPDLTWIPLETVAERVPFFGLFPKLARETTEAALGTAMAGIHAGLVSLHGGQPIAETLDKRAQDERP